MGIQKYQSVATPHGLFLLLHGAYEGKGHDSRSPREPGLLGYLEQHPVSPNGNILCIYGDTANTVKQQLQLPSKGDVLT